MARRWIRGCLLGAAVLIPVYCCVVGGLILNSFESLPPLSANARRITKGMREAEVLRIMGMPLKVHDSNDPSQSANWYYADGAMILMERRRVVKVDTYNPKVFAEGQP